MEPFYGRPRVPASFLRKQHSPVLQLVMAGNMASVLLARQLAMLQLNLAHALILYATRELGAVSAGPTSISVITGLKKNALKNPLEYLLERGLIEAVPATVKRPRFDLTDRGIETCLMVDFAVSDTDDLLRAFLGVKQLEFLRDKMPRIVNNLRWYLDSAPRGQG
jgi:DNA-binding MarR family transcriptional regulator